MWCVTEDLVLFIYSIQPGCKFQLLLGLYTLHLTGIPIGLSSIRLPSQITGFHSIVGAVQCYGDLIVMCSLQPFVI